LISLKLEVAIKLIRHLISLNLSSVKFFLEKEAVQVGRLSKSSNLLTPVCWMSGFSIGAGLAAVDIDAKLARTFCWVLRHLAAATLFKFPNIFRRFFDSESTKLRPKRGSTWERNKVGPAGSFGVAGWPADAARQTLVTSQLEKRPIENLVRS